jgi:hypothetical protein
VRILLDECLPRELGSHLQGHDVRTVQQAGWRAGWRGLKNGELLNEASGQFDTFVTIDQFLDKEQTIPANLAVITLRARSNRIQDLLPLVPSLIKALNDVKPGTSVTVGSLKP